MPPSESVAPSKDPKCRYDAQSYSRDFRMPSWQKYFSYFWGPANVTAQSNSHFDASVQSQKIGDLRLNNVRFQGQRIKRKPGHSELLDGTFHALNIVRHGAGTLTRPDTTTTVRAGEIMFSSSRCGNVFTVPKNYVSTQLMVPTKLLTDYIPNTPEVIVFHKAASSMKMSLLSCMLDQLAQTSHGQNVDGSTGGLIERQLLELLALAIETDECSPISDESSVRFAHRLRVQRFIHEHLSNPDLNPNIIAEMNGLSESYLHRIFVSSGHSLMQTVKHLRLDKAKSLLLSEAQPKLSMGEIAHQCGFASHSSFTRAFQQHFGLSPKDMRHLKAEAAN